MGIIGISSFYPYDGNAKQTFLDAFTNVTLKSDSN